MTINATENPIPLYFDTDGTPLDNGSIYFGQANQNPETNPITVYWDAAGTQPAAQPIKTVNGKTARNGNPAVVYAGSDYSNTVRNKRGSLVQSFPSASAFSFAIQIQAAMAASSGASMIGLIQAGIGAVARTVQDKCRESVSVLDFGADPSGSTDSTSAIQAAITAAAGGTLIFPKGTYLCGALTIPPASNTEIWGQNAVINFNSTGAALFSIGTAVGSDYNVNIHIHGFILNGQAKIASVGLFIGHMHGVRISDMQFYNFTSYHIRLSNAWIFQGENVVCQTTSGTCTSLLFIDVGTQQANFYNCRFLSNAGNDGVRIDQAINNAFYNCDFEGCAFGVRITQSVAVGATACDGNNFVNCDFENNNSYAFAVGPVTYGNFATAAINGTNFENCNFTGPQTLLFDQSNKARLTNARLNNVTIQTTGNALQTQASWAYSYLLTWNIATPSQWIDMNMDTGTFVPTVITSNGQSPSIYTAQVGRYTRNGRLVTIYGQVYWSNSWSATPTGSLYIQIPITFASSGAGLIFKNGEYQAVAMLQSGAGFTFTSGMQLSGYAAGGQSYIVPVQFNFNTAFVGITPPQAAGNLFFSGTFEIDNI